MFTKFGRNDVSILLLGPQNSTWAGRGGGTHKNAKPRARVAAQLVPTLSRRTHAYTRITETTTLSRWIFKVLLQANPIEYNSDDNVRSH